MKSVTKYFQRKIDKIKNRLFVYFDKFRHHRILKLKDDFGFYSCHCQYKTLLSKTWKTYQTYDTQGCMTRAIFSCDNYVEALKAAEKFFAELNKKNFIGWNNFQ